MRGVDLGTPVKVVDSATVAWSHWWHYRFSHYL